MDVKPQVALSKETHKRLRVAAALKEVRITELADKLITEGLEKEERK